MEESGELLWEPRDTDQTVVAAFINRINKEHGVHLKTYDDLYQWSIHPSSSDKFWRDVYTFLALGPPRSPPPGQVYDATSQCLFPPPVFFPREHLNVAEHLLREGQEQHVVLHFAREGRPGIEHVTYKDLRARVRGVRDAMMSSGLTSGDVVAAVISNSVDAIVLCLATLSIGAIWTSSSCDLGAGGIVDRYRQIRPKLIFADDGYVYAGKLINLQERISEWASELSGDSDVLQDVIIIPYCGLGLDESRFSKGRTFEKFLLRGTGRELDFNMVPFSHPAFILFSSGTTGVPKCIVHSGGGVLLKAKTDMVIQHDVRKTDITFQYTTTSWVMWTITFVNIASGSSMLLYDGSPFYPTPTVLLQLAQDVGVTVFGTSSKYLSELRARGILPRQQFNLDHLRVVTSTGSALQAHQYHWFYKEAFPPHVHLISMSGGTDIAGGFVGGTPLQPVYAGEIQAKSLGMAVNIFDPAQDEAISIEASGQAGELVCSMPFPSQPLTFFGADGQEKYRKSYFERFGIEFWWQGDYIQRVQPTGGFVILGRSDGVLNPSGVRFGSAEIYAVTETFPDISDSICVGQRRSIDEDESVLLFVLMKPERELTDALKAKLKSSISNKYSTRHVPRYIFEVKDIPYTVNGKKCEINVKHIVSGRDVAVSGTVANPEALKHYIQFINLPPTRSKSNLNRVGKL